MGDLIFLWPRSWFTGNMFDGNDRVRESAIENRMLKLEVELNAGAGSQHSTCTIALHTKKKLFREPRPPPLPKYNNRHCFEREAHVQSPYQSCAWSIISKITAQILSEKHAPTAMGMVPVSDDNILDGTSRVFEEDLHM